MAVGDILTWASQNQSAPAHVARILQTILLNEGVVDVAGNSFQVLENTGADMNIKIGSGVVGDLAVVEGDDAAGQGIYVHEAQNGTVTRAVAASDPSDPRIDRVVLQNYDDEADSSGLNDAEVEVLQGTPAASPVAPAIPSSAISLATIAVGAGVTAIINANITDTRAEAKTTGELVETVYFTASGSFDKADRPWLRTVVAKVVGGGGGGGGAVTTGAGEAAAGEGGGGGQYREGRFDVSVLAASETVTVGAGGAGNVGAAGNNGGASSFGSHITANGGTGGGVSAAGTSSTATTGPAGGSGGSGGSLNIPGGAGEGLLRAPPLVRGGSGGGSQFAGRTQTRATTSHGNGFAGIQYGGGGGGAANTASQGTARSGGPGASGIIVLDLYA